MFKQSRTYTAVRPFLMVVGTVALVEILIHGFFHVSQSETWMSETTHAIADVVTLTIASLVALFFWVFKPRTLAEQLALADKALREKAVQQANEERARIESIIAAIGDSVSVQDTDFRILYQNAANKSIMGERIGEYCYTAYEHKAQPCDGCGIALSFKDGGLHTIERSVPTAHGTMWVEITSSPLRDSSGKIIAGIEVVRDISERKRAEEELREKEYLLSESQRIGRIGTWSADLATNAITWTEETFRLYGVAPGQFTPTAESLPGLLHPDDRGAMREHMEAIVTGTGAVPSMLEFRVILPDGSLRMLSGRGELIRGEDGRPMRLVGTIQDITGSRKTEEEKQKLQLQLAQAQKMETVGQLAGGVAHDFNNILTAILGNTYILQMKTKENVPLRSYLEDIRSSAEKAANLTQSLLAFSRKQIMNPKPLSVNRLVAQVHKLMARLLSEDIVFKNNLAPEEITVMADSGQLEQVIMNLVTNARDAMPNGGSLTITTGLKTIDEGHIGERGCGVSGPCALISVCDNGTGMDGGTRERIFEPFFTTKEVGKGTGLGLSMAYGIVKQHNGFIDCHSEPGLGTTFEIYLPLIESRINENPACAVMPARGTETILLAEDDPKVRQTTKQLLEEFGYTVIEAVDGADAVQKFEENKDAVRMLILDVVMPRKNGKEAFEEIRRVKTDVKALFLSGYANDIIHKHCVLDDSLNYLAKPAEPNSLLAKVREMFDEVSVPAC